MAQYVAFVSEGHDRWFFDKVDGYFNCLSDIGILKDIVIRDVSRREDLMDLSEDGVVMNMLLKGDLASHPSGYVVVRAEVVDEDALKGVLPEIHRHFELDHRIYERA